MSPTGGAYAWCFSTWRRDWEQGERWDFGVRWQGVVESPSRRVVAEVLHTDAGRLVEAETSSLGRLKLKGKAKNSQSQV